MRDKAENEGSFVHLAVFLCSALVQLTVCACDSFVQLAVFLWSEEKWLQLLWRELLLLKADLAIN